jgi:hypothetical protein
MCTMQVWKMAFGNAASTASGSPVNPFFSGSRKEDIMRKSRFTEAAARAPRDSLYERTNFGGRSRRRC